MGYNYRMVRVLCEGTIKTCSRCEKIDFTEGYCPQCGRPLWRKQGEPCKSILGYVERTGYQNQKQGNANLGKKVNFICRNCSTVTTL